MNTFPSLDKEEDDYTKKYVLNKIYSLPTKFKIVIILYYFEEKKINEISSILKTKESTIKMRLKKAKELLKQEIGEL